MQQNNTIQQIIHKDLSFYITIKYLKYILVCFFEMPFL